MKMKYSKILIFSICLFFVLVKSIYASSYYATVNFDSIALRNGPGTNYNAITYLNTSAKYMLESVEKKTTEEGCNDGWYVLNYNGTKGYICSSYVTITELDLESLTTCADKLKAIGFPDSYVSGLCELKEIHPSWEFIPLLTNLEWNEAVENESSCGQSYVNTDKEENIDRTCVNQYKTTGKGWYPASKKIVAYYMDPRNFFNEKYIFQFDALSYSESLKEYYPKGIDSILNGVPFYTYHNTLGNNFASTLNEAAKNANVNAVFLSSRILQEIGRTDKLYNLYSGIYPGYEGYYNFYNYGVTDSCATSYGTTYCGLTYAKNQGWNGLYNALFGGANMMADLYIAKNQNTNYLQKYNVVPLESNKKYFHQYMTNIAAPSSESASSYNVYSQNNLLDSPFIFYIPVYNNMTGEISNTGSGASNESNNNETSNIDINTIITSSGYRYSGSYISGIEIGSTVGEFKNALESVGANSKIIDNNDNEVTDGILKTGYHVTISNNSGSINLTVVVKGDTSGDGIVNALDLLQVQKNILGTFSMQDAYFEAADTSKDGKINALDLLQIQKYILGTYKIEK